MPEVQTFLQKKKDQNTGGKDHRQNLRNRRKKTAMISMAAELFRFLPRRLGRILPFTH